MILTYFLLISISISSETKNLTPESCDKVSEELSAQGFTFEEKFQLNNLNIQDSICLQSGKEKTALSCCTRLTEKILVETATTEYEQVFQQEMITLVESLKKIHTNIQNISIEIILEFSLKMKKSSHLIPKREIVSKLVATFLSFLNGTISENECRPTVEDYILQFIDIIDLRECDNSSKHSPQISKNRKRRHWRHENVSRVSGTFSSREKRRIRYLDLEVNLSNALQTLMTGLNITKLFLNVFNTSLGIVARISKCRECISPEGCSTNVMRMNHCSYCAGEALSRPCFSVCLQVISGCIWRLQSLSSDWKDLFNITENYFMETENQDRLQNSFIDVFIKIHEKIQKIYLEYFKEGCDFDRNIYPFFSDNLKRNFRNLAVYIGYEARQIKLFWENLAVTMCTRSKWFSSLSHSRHCWNGSDMASPQWHKCSFCHDKRERFSQVPRIVTHSVKEIISLKSDIQLIMSISTAKSRKKHRKSSFNSGNVVHLDQSLDSVKSKKETPKKNKSKGRNSSWKDLNINNFIIFDLENSLDEEGSGKNDFSSLLKPPTAKLSAFTPQPIQSKRSIIKSQYRSPTISIFTSSMFPFLVAYLCIM